MNYFSYFSEIEELFIRRRGRNLLLSPIDWALIEAWRERGVPLHIVLSAIERVFDGVEKQPEAARKRPIKSLTYCRDEIETQYADWLERQVGKNGGEPQISKSKVRSSKSPEAELFSAETVKAHIEKVSTDLKNARAKTNGKLGACLEEVLNRLRALGGDWRTSENLEQTLEKLDASVDDALLRSELAGAEIKAEIKKQLAAYIGKMDADALERTFNLMLLKALRERAGLPRLSLFHL